MSLTSVGGVIEAGGGGIPTVYEPCRQLREVEAVIGKDPSQLSAGGRHNYYCGHFGH
jgi:carbamate kinase